MLIRPTTKLSEVIQSAQRDKAISLLEIPANLLSGQPPGIIATAIGYEDIQLLLDTVRPITDFDGLNYCQVNLKHMFFNVSGKYPGYVPHQTLVFANLLEHAQRSNKIITLVFEPWYPQRIPATVIVAASGRAHCERLRALIIPALQREEKLKEDNPLTGHTDLPIDFIPKEQ